MQFPSLFPKLDILQDSYAASLIEKAAENFEYLNGNPDYFNRISGELFSRVAFQLGTPEEEEALAEAKGYTDTFFDSYNPLIDANKKLEECRFNPNENQFLEKEAPALLAYLNVIQKKCQEHLDKIPKEYGYITDKYKEINRNVQNPELKLKAHFPPKPLTPIEDETIEPSDLTERDLVGLSSNLAALHETREELENLKQASEAMFQAINEWRTAKELGKTPELPPLEKFMELRDQVKAISRKELNFPPNLLQKASRCSRAAGRALEQVAEFSKRLNDQIQETKKGLEDSFQEHLRDFNLWKLITQSKGKTPSAQDYIDQLNIDPLTLNHLKAIDWLHKLPETQLKNLEQAFSDLSPAEKQHFKRIIEECSTPEEFFQRLSDYYDEKIKAVASKAQKNNQALERERALLQQEVKTRETTLACLSDEKTELDQQIQKLAQQLDAIKKEQNAKSEEAQKESERKFQALKRQIEELNKRASALESEKSGLTAQIQTLNQNLAKNDAQHAKAQESANKQIKDLETHCQNLQKELTASTASRDQVSTGLAGQIRELRDQLEKSVSESKGQLQALETQLRDKDAQVAVLKEEKASLHAQIRTLRQQTEKKKDWESQLKTLTLQLGEKDAQVTSLKDEKKGLEKEIRVLKDQTEKALSDTQEKILSLQKELADQQKQVARTESEKTLLARKMGEGENALAAAQRRLDSLQKELEGQQSTVSNSQSKKAALKEQIRAIRELSEKQRAEAQARLDTTQNELVEQKRVVAALETEKAALEKRIQDLKVQFETERSTALSTLYSHLDEIAEQKGKALRLKHEKRNLEVRIKDLTNDCSDAQSEIENLKSELELRKEQIANSVSYEAQLEQLQNELKEKKEARFQDRSTLNTLQRELAQQKGLVASLESEKAGLENRIRELSAQVENFQIERGAAQNKLEGLPQKLAEQKEHVASLEKVMAGLEQEFRELDQRSANELSDANKQLESLQKDLEEERGKRTHAETVVEGLNHQIQQLNEQLQAVQTSAATAQSESERTIEDLEEQKRRLEAELRIQNRDTHPPGSIGHTYSDVLGDSVDLGDFMLNLQKSFVEELQSKNRAPLQPDVLLERLKDIHQRQGDHINWNAIHCMADFFQLVFPQQVAFELLSQFIRHTQATQELKELQEKQERYGRSEFYFPKGVDFHNFLKSSNAKFRKAINEQQSHISVSHGTLRTLSTFLGAAEGLYFSQSDYSLESPLEEMQSLYKLLNFETPLTNYNDPIKFSAKKEHTPGEPLKIKEILVCHGDVKFWNKPDFFINGNYIFHTYFSPASLAYDYKEPENQGDAPLCIKLGNISPETIIPIYGILKQGLLKSVPIAIEKRLENLRKGISDLAEEKNMLDAKLRDLNRKSADENGMNEFAKKRYNEAVSKIDGTRKLLEDQLQDLTEKQKVVAELMSAVEEPDSKLEELKKQVKKFFDISD